MVTAWLNNKATLSDSVPVEFKEYFLLVLKNNNFILFAVCSTLKNTFQQVIKTYYGRRAHLQLSNQIYELLWGFY